MKSKGSLDQQLDQAAHEFVECLRRGENPAPADYAERYPDLAARILEMFPMLAVMEGGAGPSGAATGPPRLAAELELPRRIGDYLVVREIGRGGMGVVYEAQQLSLLRRVALKLLPTHAVLNPVQLERFRREAQAAAGLQHRNIVPVYEVSDQLGVYFYAMQFVRGIGLDGVVREVRRMGDASPDDSTWIDSATDPDDCASTVVSGLLAGRFVVDHAGLKGAHLRAGELASNHKPTAERIDSQGEGLGTRMIQSTGQYFRSVARIGAEVAEALEYAHRQGVLHRDIKPSNVLVDLSGTAWVTDFGLAKIDGSDNLTNTGDVAGTIRYMAPERLRGWSDPRSDVYGVGLTLYELATLRPAFDESDQGRLVAQIAQDNPPDPRQIASGLPRDLETVILKAISKEPAQRYQSAGELAADLSRFLAGEPITARRTSRLERTRLWCRRNPLVASLSGSVGMLLVLLAVGSMVAAVWLRQQRDAAVESERVAVSSKQEADREAERARKEAAKAAEINRLLQEAFALADPNNAPGQEVTVREVLDRAVEKLADGLAEQPEVEAALRDTIGWTYKGLGQFEKAELQLRESLALRRAVLRGNHPDLATSLEHLSIVLGGVGVWGPGRTDEAIALCREAIDIRREALGPDHPDTRAVEAFLLFLEQSEIDRVASPTGEDAAAWVRLRVVGIDDIEQSLGRIRELWRSGQRDATLRFIDEVTAPARERFANPARFADGMSMIGSQRATAGDFDVAEPMLRAALELYRAEYGRQHPSIAKTLRALGKALAGRGSLDAAERAYRESIEMQGSLLGEEHPELARTLSSLAGFLRDKRKDSQQAESVYREALSIQRKTTSNIDPTITWTMQGLARLLYKQNRDLDEAEALYRESLSIHRRLFGDDSPQTAWTLYLLAKLLHYGRRQHDEAETFYREALHIRRRALGNAHAETASSIQYLAKLLHYEQGKPDEAEALYREALAIRQKILTARHPNTARSMLHLARLLHEERADLDAAETLLREALSILKRTLPENSLSVAEAREQMAKLDRDRQRAAASSTATGN